MKPPQKIDGATVVKVADLAGAGPTRLTRHAVKGEPAGDFTSLAIARYDSDPGYYLFYCDAEWQALTDTYHESLEAAVAQAEFEFRGVSFIEPVV